MGEGMLSVRLKRSCGIARLVAPLTRALLQAIAEAVEKFRLEAVVFISKMPSPLTDFNYLSKNGPKSQRISLGSPFYGVKKMKTARRMPSPGS
jgi:hypothetical protein